MPQHQAPPSRGGRTAATRAELVGSVARMLEGIDLPTTKTKVVRYARENRNAVTPAEEIVHLLERLPSKAFQTMAEIERQVGKIR